jgi:alpha-mannosidase
MLNYTSVSHLNVTAWVTPEPVSYTKRRSGQKKDLVQGQKWGKLWDCAWFHMLGKVPQSAAGKHVVLIIDVNGEACVFDKTGTPVLGLTSKKSRTNISLGMPAKYAALD